MNTAKKIIALTMTVCFFLLPGTALAGGLTGGRSAAEVQAKAVSGPPARTDKPTKFPAGGNSPAAKSSPKAGSGQTPAGKKPAAREPSVSGTAGRSGVKTSAQTQRPKTVNPAKPAEKVDPPKEVKPAKQKKSKKKKDNDRKKSGGMKIACKETSPFFPAKKVDALIKTARKYIGVKYVYGGADPRGFDCSGYIMYILRSQGAKVPRTADAQYDVGGRVEGTKNLVKGDLVFFSDDRREISHVGLYLGSGNFIHASTSKGVRIDSLSNEYWKPRYAGAKHLIK